MVCSMSLWSISVSLPMTSFDSRRQTTCEHFIVLTMQRSGSRSLNTIINAAPMAMADGELFNFGDRWVAKHIADSLQLTSDDIRNHGVQWWSEKMFSYQENHSLRPIHHTCCVRKPTCAVGFRAFENPVVYGNHSAYQGNFLFNYEEMKPILENPMVKKIILERSDTKAQWLSFQRACSFGDMSDHHHHDSHIDQLGTVTEHVQSGDVCGTRVVSNFTLFEHTKHDMYRRWYNLLDSTSQSYMVVKTEELDNLEADPSQLHEFVLEKSRHSQTKINNCKCD